MSRRAKRFANPGAGKDGDRREDERRRPPERRDPGPSRWPPPVVPDGVMRMAGRRPRAGEKVREAVTVASEGKSGQMNGEKVLAWRESHVRARLFSLAVKIYLHSTNLDDPKCTARHWEA